MSRHGSRLVTGVLSTMIPIPAESADPLPPGTHDRVQVAAPTRLDWVFTISNQSPAKPPAEWPRKLLRQGPVILFGCACWGLD